MATTSKVPFPGGETIGAYREDGIFDCRQAFEWDMFEDELTRYPMRGDEQSGPNAIYDRAIAAEDPFDLENWVPQHDDLVGHPRAEEAFEAWQAGWKSCAVQKIKDRLTDRWHDILADADLFYVMDPDGVELERYDDIDEALEALARMPAGSKLDMEVQDDGPKTRALLAWIDPEHDRHHMQLATLYTLPAHGYRNATKLRGFPELRRAAKQGGKANPASSTKPRRNPRSLSDWAGDDEVYAFTKAMMDPDPSSTEVAQDILLESGVAHALWIVGDDIYWRNRTTSDRGETPGPQALLEQRYGEREGRAMMLVDQGMFQFTFSHDGDDVENHVIWVLTNLVHRGVDKGYRASYWYKYGAEPNRRGRIVGIQDPLTSEINLGSSADSNDARGRAARYAWAAFAIMKESRADGLTAQQFMQRVLVFSDERVKEIPFELNPARGRMAKNPADPQDLEQARAKYQEFHRYAPKKEIWKPNFKLPTQLLDAGRSKWVTYRSGKVDPATGKLPKAPVDYIHEHDAGVHTYIPDPDADTDVPKKFCQVTALEKLGDCLGFCIMTADGDVEAQGTNPFPELYATPDGKCLVVVQGKKKVLAMMWGGALGVFARGIDG